MKITIGIACFKVTIIYFAILAGLATDSFWIGMLALIMIGGIFANRISKIGED